jgi:transcriptional regulator with XRE-family HTH domain
MRISNFYDLEQEFKRARIASRLTQREAAAAAGVSPTLISQFERGALTEMGAIKLLSLLRTVGLQLQVGPAAQPQRTLKDIEAELDAALVRDPPQRALQRVRHSRKRV